METLQKQGIETILLEAADPLIGSIICGNILSQRVKYFAQRLHDGNSRAQRTVYLLGKSTTYEKPLILRDGSKRALAKLLNRAGGCMRRFFTLSLLCVFVLGLVSIANADTLIVGPTTTCGGATDSCGFKFTYTFTDLTGGNFSFLFRVEDVGIGSPPVSHDAFLQLLSATALSGDITSAMITSIDPSLPAGVTVGLTEDSSGNNGSTCTGNVSGALCLAVTSTNGIPLDFVGDFQEFSGTIYAPGASLLSSWNVKALGTGDANGGSGGNVFALSTDGTPDRPQVPEPATLALMGTGLAGLGRLIRRKK